MKNVIITLFIFLVLVGGCEQQDPNSALLTGADKLVNEEFVKLSGLRIGLITNHTATVNNIHLADLLHESDVVSLTTLFGPEHGIRGDAPAGERIQDDIDAKTGVPVYSLYGEIRKPTPEMLNEIDVLVFDIQDVGARFYTYISTMGYGMQAAAREGIPFVVLDRPNPLGGELVEGYILEEGYESFVGLYPIPIAHGLTVGELAKMIQGEGWLDGIDNLDLQVVGMEGWKRNMLWNDISRNWNPPSTNIPTFETALIYPGACFFEGTIASEGRGTYEPFMVLGAPWINKQKLSDELNSRNLPGLKFEPVTFIPESIEGMVVRPKFDGIEVNGIRYIVTDKKEVKPVEAGVHILQAFFEQSTEKNEFFRERGIQRLSGSDRLHKNIIKGMAVEDICADWEEEVNEFYKLREKYLMYDN